MKILAHLADTYALYMLHKQKSLISHFKPSERRPLTYEDNSCFYTKPDPIEITFETARTLGTHDMGSFSYPSQVDNGPSNKEVKGLFYETKNNQDNLNIILVHGWRMSSRERLDNLFLDSFLKEGYNLYQFTLPFHLERSSQDSLYSGELMISADIDRTLRSVQQGVSDLRALISWLKAHRPGKVILLGVSLGGLVANLTATVNDQADGLISLFYANSLPCTIWETLPGKYIKEDFTNNGFSYEELEKYWAITIPSNFQPLISKDNILLLTGDYDRYIAGHDSNQLWLAWNKPKRISFPYGHSGIVLGRKTLGKDILSFIRTLRC